MPRIGNRSRQSVYGVALLVYPAALLAAAFDWRWAFAVLGLATFPARGVVHPTRPARVRRPAARGRRPGGPWRGAEFRNRAPHRRRVPSHGRHRARCDVHVRHRGRPSRQGADRHRGAGPPPDAHGHPQPGHLRAAHTGPHGRPGRTDRRAHDVLSGGGAADRRDRLGGDGLGRCRSSSARWPAPWSASASSPWRPPTRSLRAGCRAGARSRRSSRPRSPRTPPRSSSTSAAARRRRTRSTCGSRSPRGWTSAS